MDFSAITSMGNFTKTMKMKTQWKMKKDSREYTKKIKSNNDSTAQQTRSKGQSQIESIKKQLDELKENRDDNLEMILLKVKCGRKLTAEEMEYLSEKSPEEYREYKEVQAQREHYKQELKKCKTKEDVQRLRTTQLGNSLTRISAIANDPLIPKSKKLELCMQENAKVNAMIDETNKFVESGRYHRLPTEDEREEELRRKEEETRGEQPDPETIERETDKKVDKDISSEKTEEASEGESKTDEKEAEPARQKSETKAKQSYFQAVSVYREMMTWGDVIEDDRFIKNRRSKKMA